MKKNLSKQEYKDLLATPRPIIFDFKAKRLTNRLDDKTIGQKLGIVGDAFNKQNGEMGQIIIPSFYGIELGKTYSIEIKKHE